MESRNPAATSSRFISGRKRISADDLAYFELRDLLSSGELPPEEQISEETLAELLGVSRTPLRAALTRLRFEGLIDRATNGRLFVPPVSVEDAAQLFAVRIALEELALEAGFLHVDQDMLAVMRSFIEQMGVLRGVSAREVGLYGGEFHGVLYKAGGNPLNLALLAQLQGRIDRYRFLSTGTGQERQDKAIEEHRQILAAIEQRDLPGAKAALRAHLEGALASVQNAIRAQSVSHEISQKV